MRNKNKFIKINNQKFIKHTESNKKEALGSDGFTLIELLVVIAIIALLSSVALIAFMSARQKGRDAKRVSDMVQMNTALALYFSTFKGFPSSVNGIPSPLVTGGIANSLPSNPLPGDGGCDQISYASPVPSGNFGDHYYYYASGTSYIGNDNIEVYPDYGYYFCLGNITGNLPAGLHVASPAGLR